MHNAKLSACEKVYRELFNEPVPCTPIFVDDECAPDDSQYEMIESCATHFYDFTIGTVTDPINDVRQIMHLCDSLIHGINVLYVT